MKNSNKKSDFTKYLDNKHIGSITLRNFLIKCAYYLALVIIIPLLLPSGRSFKYTDLQVGSIVNKKVIAPFNFPVLKTEQELDADRKEATAVVPYYFSTSDSFSIVQLKEFNRFFNYIGSLPRDIHLNTLSESDTVDTLSMNEVVSTLSVDYNIALTVEEISQLLSLLYSSNKDSLRRSLNAKLKFLYNKNHIDISKSEIKNRDLVLIRSGIEEDILPDELLDPQEWQATLNSVYSSRRKHAVIKKIVTLYTKPNILYDREYTDQQFREAVAQVPTPPVPGPGSRPRSRRRG